MKPEKPSRKKAAPPAAKSISKPAEPAPAPPDKPSPAAKSKKKIVADEPVDETPAPAPKIPAAKAKKKVATKISIPDVPPILLEGDQPPAAPASGPGKRYDLGSAPSGSSPSTEGSQELPEAYGTKKLFLAARDPHWLYARWDLTREQQRNYNSLSIDRHLALKIFVDQIKGEPLVQIHVHPESTHWFAFVGQAGTKYLAELGYFQAKGKWVTISTSAPTLTPPDDMSEDLSAEFATIPMDISFAQLMNLAKVAVQQNIPLVEVIQQLRATGYKIPDLPAGAGWTPEREQALASIITMDRVRRVWMGSMEITELIRRQLEISSAGVAEFSRPTSEMGGVTSLSSAFGGAGERKKGFWFNVNAELIIYGATEPDAEVSIGGRVIKLRPDGNFSFRFALPDGNYELPAVAISADNTDGRAAELKFSRSTEYRGDVGIHPQDPKLKPPLVANVE